MLLSEQNLLTHYVRELTPRLFFFPNRVTYKWLTMKGKKKVLSNNWLLSCVVSVSALPLCSLGIMKDAWDRLRQCIIPNTTIPHCGHNNLQILNQVFHFACGTLIIPSSSCAATFPTAQTSHQTDPRAITSAILQQQQRAEVWLSALFLLFFPVVIHMLITSTVGSHSILIFVFL